MEKIKSKSEKRLIVPCTVNNKEGNFLIDTGASISLMNERKKKEYNLIEGKRFTGTIIGAGGQLRSPKMCDTPVNLKGKLLSQFMLTDIQNIIESIKKETGIEILGIIGLPQMKFAGIQIDANDNLIIIE